MPQVVKTSGLAWNRNSREKKDMNCGERVKKLHEKRRKIVAKAVCSINAIPETCFEAKLTKPIDIPSIGAIIGSLGVDCNIGYLFSSQ